MSADRIDALIANSSLGSPGAVELRKRTPVELAQGLVHKAERLRGIRHLDVHIEDRRRTPLKTSPQGRRANMAKDNNRHVVPNPDGGWDIKKPGAERASSHHDTQGDAQQRAREIVGNAGGGEVRIHGRDGRIRDSDTVPPGNDPNPPRDKK